VRWTATRSESFVSDAQGRDHVTKAELAFDGDGHFLALRVTTSADIGAYISTFGVSIPSVIYTTLLAGVYRTPAIYVEVTTVFTNSVPTDAYRGAGRPEACYVLDRLADRAARHLGLNGAEIRRRNLIPSAAMPYKTPIGPTYDCGDFPRLLARALEASDYATIDERRAEAKRRGRYRGIGIAMYVESSGVAPSKLAGAMGARTGLFESAEVRVDATGGVMALLGTHNHGQGHATSFAQVLKTRLGVPLDKIEIVEGDTALVPYGTGTFGSRSMAVGGSALANAADKIVVKAKRIAGHLLETAAADLLFQDGTFTVSGTDKRITFLDVTRAAHMAHNLPSGTEPGLHESAFFDPVNFAFSAGCHVAEVEIDPDTGVVQLVRHTVVDDVGTVINPMIVEGQVQGGLAQGIGQALFEHVAWDAASGQVLSGSFMDYALPRAGDLPFFHTETDESQPFPHNPLGAKGCGESGTIGAPSAIVGALLDALAPLGITEIDMPLTSRRVWETLSRAPNRGR
jgi:carbon-monoxide dehydrogenase large subunit